MDGLARGPNDVMRKAAGNPHSGFPAGGTGGSAPGENIIVNRGSIAHNLEQDAIHARFSLRSVRLSDRR